MSTVQCLKELVQQLNNATLETEKTIAKLENEHLEEVERKHLVGNLLLTLDMMILINRKRLEEIRNSL